MQVRLRTFTLRLVVLIVFILPARPIEVVARDRLEDYLRDMHFAPLEAALKEASEIEPPQLLPAVGDEGTIEADLLRGKMVPEEPVFRQLQTKLRVAS
jgi:hypothetical protein